MKGFGHVQETGSYDIIILEHTRNSEWMCSVSFDLLGRTGRKNALIVSGSSNAPPVIFNNGCHV